MFSEDATQNLDQPKAQKELLQTIVQEVCSYLNCDRKQNIYPSEVEKQPPKANNFPKKISELQKISQLLVENQTALQQLKLKISLQSTSNNSLINQVQDINQKNITIETEYF